MASACDDCGKPMSDQAVVCPHCGARQLERDPLPGQRALDREAGRPASDKTGPEPLLPKKALEGLSSAEVGALLASDPKSGRRVGQGPIASLLLPSPHTTGGIRLAEVALTAFGLPLVIGGAVLVGASRWMARRKARPGVGAELTGVVIALGPGELAFYELLSLFDVADPWPYLLACGGAVLARAALRLTAARRRDRE